MIAGVAAAICPGGAAENPNNYTDECNPDLFKDVSHKWSDTQIKLVFLHWLQEQDYNNFRADKGFQSLVGVGEKTDFGVYSDKERRKDEQTQYTYSGQYQAEFLGSRLTALGAHAYSDCKRAQAFIKNGIYASVADLAGAKAVIEVAWGGNEKATGSVTIVGYEDRLGNMVPVNEEVPSNNKTDITVARDPKQDEIISILYRPLNADTPRKLAVRVPKDYADPPVSAPELHLISASGGARGNQCPQEILKAKLVELCDTMESCEIALSDDTCNGRDLSSGDPKIYAMSFRCGKISKGTGQVVIGNTIAISCSASGLTITKQPPAN
jgi:hypothetical protein